MAAEQAAERGPPLELRVAGNTVAAVIPLGEPATDRPEVLEDLVPMAEVALNIQHDPALVVASTTEGNLRLERRAEGLAVEADLSPELVRLVRSGAFGGMSPEFYATAERRESGVRYVTSARLEAIGLVDAPAYRSPIEVRHSQEGRLRLLRRILLAG